MSLLCTKYCEALCTLFCLNVITLWGINDSICIFASFAAVCLRAYVQISAAKQVVPSGCALTRIRDRYLSERTVVMSKNL